jgi:hypothetical protein
MILGRSFTLEYVFLLFIDVMNLLISSSDISFAGLGFFFFVNFLDLISILYLDYDSKTLCFVFFLSFSNLVSEIRIDRMRGVGFEPTNP